MVEVQTGVDELMKLVQKEEKISVGDAAKKLKVPEATLQAWVDFLVEDHILGIEYKFTTPYIYVHSEERVNEIKKDKSEVYTLTDYKNGFISRAREKKLPEEKIPQLWSEHLLFVVKQHKDYFVKECERRGVPEAEDLYDEYYEVMTHAT